MSSGISKKSEIGAAKPRLAYIDGLRAFAMLGVMFAHAVSGYKLHMEVTPFTQTYDLMSLFMPGGLGVTLFLVLSGFCLYWPMALPGRSDPTLWEYFKRRCRRILPPYYVALSIFGGLALFFTAADGVRYSSSYIAQWFFWHVFMLQSTNPTYMMTIDGPTWSLGLEFSLYLMFPLLVVLFRRFSKHGTIMAVAAICLLFHYFTLADGLGFNDPLQGVLKCSPFAKGICFVAGMYAAHVVATSKGKTKLNLARIDIAALLAMAPVAIWNLIEQADSPLPILVFADVAWGVLFAALVIAASRQGALLNRVFSTKAMVSLGVFSYSTYLIHQPLMHFLRPLVTTSGAFAPLATIGIIGALIAAGYAFHILFEKPFMGKPSKLCASGRDNAVFIPARILRRRAKVGGIS